MKAERSARIISPLFFFMLWYIISRIINAPLILPYPHVVALRLIEISKTQLFWLSFGATVFRVFAAFVISFILGFFTGLFSADYSIVQNLLSFPLNVIRSTPLVAFILLALFWFKSGSVPVFVAVLMALPVMITASEKGFAKNSENQEKLFKANCYGFTGFKAFWYIRLPSAMPSLLSAAESSFGLCWKVVAAGEVLSIPRNAAGSLMQKAQVHLETADVLAVTFTLVIISFVCQKLVVYFIKRRYN